MTLYLVRHAIAAERGEEWPEDDRRPLTEEGILRFTSGVRGLEALDVTVDEIFTSPLVRARHTAALLAAGVGGTPPVKVLEALAPGHSPTVVRTQLAKAVTQRRVALVGHEPDLGELAARLIGASHALPFRKGAVCRIDLSGLGARHRGTLRWFVTPKALRRLGGRAPADHIGRAG
jgi:phosphohistidine phosphatase